MNDDKINGMVQNMGLNGKTEGMMIIDRSDGRKWLRW